jgi:hypothetical protein
MYLICVCDESFQVLTFPTPMRQGVHPCIHWGDSLCEVGVAVRQPHQGWKTLQGARVLVPAVCVCAVECV